MESAYSMVDGTVEYAGWAGGYGNQVRVKDYGGTVYSYNHLSSIHVTTGQKVTKGQKIAVLGNTGLSKGVHLHFEVIVNGEKVNPWPYIRCFYPRSDEENEKPDERCNK
jgi:murein DD-endopeptidase MepM/ murein hydrolase activator NlpD